MKIKLKLSSYTKIISLIVIGVLSLTIGYASLSTRLNIQGDAYLTKGEGGIVISDISAPICKNGAVENYDASYSNLLTTFNGTLSSTDLSSEISYFITFNNQNSSTYEFVDYTISSLSNDNIIIDTYGMGEGFTVNSLENIVIRLTFKYNSTLTEIPENTSFGALIEFNFKQHISSSEEVNYMSYVSHDLLLNLNGYDEQTNNKYWSDNLGNSLTLYGDVYHNAYDKYYYFDGNGDYATATKSYIPETGDFTLELFIKTQEDDFSSNVDESIVSQISDSTNSTGRFKVNIRKTNSTTTNLQTFYNPSTNTNPQTSFKSSILKNTIYHVQLIRKGNTLYYFSEGQLATTYTLDATEKICTENLKLSKWTTASPQYFKGAIYALRIYNVALLSTQIDSSASTDELYQNYSADMNNYSIQPYEETEENLYNYSIAYNYTTSGDGLYYDADFDRYFFRGKSPKNYVKTNYNTYDSDGNLQNNLNNYRVVSLESDRTVKLVSRDLIGPIAYDPAPPSDETGFCVGTTTSGCNPWTIFDSLTGVNQAGTTVTGSSADECSLNTYLNTTWYNSLGTMKQYLLQGTYAVGRISDGSTYDQINQDSVTKYWTGYVAIPTIKMIFDTAINRPTISSGIQSITLDSYISDMAATNKINLWTINAASNNNWDVWTVISPTSLGCRRASRTDQNNDNFYALPVIDISGDVVVSGNGTITSPFTIDFTYKARTN